MVDVWDRLEFVEEVEGKVIYFKIVLTGIYIRIEQLIDKKCTDI